MAPSQQQDRIESSSLVVTGELLTLDGAIGTFEECLRDAAVQGNFDKYEYCVGNGRPVLLGRFDGETRVKDGDSVTISMSVSVNRVFVSKNKRYRWTHTWDELPESLADGWQLGTERSRGIKIWFVDSGRNSRREPERILVLP